MHHFDRHRPFWPCLNRRNHFKSLDLCIERFRIIRISGSKFYQPKTGIRENFVTKILADNFLPILDKRGFGVSRARFFQIFPLDRQTDSPSTS